MITAKYAVEDAGTEADKKRIRKCGLVLGREYEVKAIEVHAWNTDVYLKEYDGTFNSVNFEIFEDGEELDYVNDKRFAVW